MAKREFSDSFLLRLEMIGPALIVHVDESALPLQALIDLATICVPPHRSSWLSLIDAAALLQRALTSSAWAEVPAALRGLLDEMGASVPDTLAAELVRVTVRAATLDGPLTGFTKLAHELVVLRG